MKVKCEDCGKEFERTEAQVKNSIKNYEKNLCRGCAQKWRYAHGLKTSCFAEYNKTKFAGNWEKRYGKEKADQLKKIQSEHSSGKNNPNFGAKFSHGFGETYLNRKGKTFEELYGKERSDKLKELFSNNSKGEKNHMYGKPSPQGSGNGWCGWYKNWFFRSLKELSYMINVIEHQNLKWESAETKKFRIAYTDPITGNKRTYHPDFFINDNILIEIKPKHLCKTLVNLEKQKAAIKFCEKMNWTYKMETEESFKKLTDEEIMLMYNNNKIKFIKRYEEKFIKMKGVIKDDIYL
jgi:DNA-directed RNA polymerase subunit RPC12/RpoP